MVEMIYLVGTVNGETKGKRLECTSRRILPVLAVWQRDAGPSSLISSSTRIADPCDWRGDGVTLVLCLTAFVWLCGPWEEFGPSGVRNDRLGLTVTR